MRKTEALPFIVLILLAAIGCQEAVAPHPAIGTMSAVSPMAQNVVVGNAVSQPPTVVVRDGHSQPVKGVGVTFVDTAAHLAVTVTTGTDGTAATPWFVGTRAGFEFLSAMVDGLVSVVFIANVQAGAPYAIQQASVAEQVADPGQVLPTQPKVLVRDQFGNPTPGVTVTFTAAGPADGTTTSTTATTDVHGIATHGDWALGTAAGEYTMTASYAGQTYAPFTFRVRINKAFPVSLIAAGGTASCAVAVGGGLYCWGAGLLASATVTPTLVPTAVSFVSLTMGDHHACGLTSAGAAYCWGNNNSGQLGIGSLSENEAQPRAVGGGLTFASLAAGDSFTCGLTTDQRVFCWGDNIVGELGNGNTTPSLTPSAVSTSGHFTALTAGLGHACAIATTGPTYCWGADNTGQSGGSSTDICTVPGQDYYGPSVTDVNCSKIPIVVSIAPGNFIALVASQGTCGLLVGALTAYCWGFPFAAPLLPSNPFLSLAAAGESICGITPRPTILCWSYSTDPYSYGALLPPAQVFGVDAPTSLVAGADHWCAIAGTTSLAYCWGNNTDGQLGDGIRASSTQAIPVASP